MSNFVDMNLICFSLSAFLTWFSEFCRIFSHPKGHLCTGSTNWAGASPVRKSTWKPIQNNLIFYSKGKIITNVSLLMTVLPLSSTIPSLICLYWPSLVYLISPGNVLCDLSALSLYTFWSLCLGHLTVSDHPLPRYDISFWLLWEAFLDVQTCSRCLSCAGMSISTFFYGM